MFGDRIKQAREAQGLSLRALADQVGLSQTAINKYEKGELAPSSGALLKLARALGVRTDYFFRTETVTLEAIEYHTHPSVPPRVLAKVQADAREQLEREFELDRILPGSIPPFEPPDLPERIESADQIENAALAVRHAWKLGENPIPDLIDTLEARGIAVLLTRAHGDTQFDGLAARVDGHPVIVVGADWPGDRQRFTLAHELGHLLLHQRLTAGLDEERCCHRFAGAFLIPAGAVFAALGRRRTWLEPRELMLLKAEYGLSMGAWLYRAHDLGILSKTQAGRMHGFFRKQGWHRREPGEPYPSEHTRRFARSVYHALAEDLISESKAAELMARPLMEFHRERLMDVADAAAHQ